MLKVFVCYSRQSEAIVTTLVDDIEALGHDVWFDRELSGGQAWWDQILKRICDADVFVIALAPEALNSIACNREYGYAGDLGKPILPVVVAEGISPNLLPRALSAIQLIDYQVRDSHSAFRLARAINTVPSPKPLPEPLPPSPEVPRSYLGGLRDQVETTATLGFAEQGALLLELKRSLGDPDAAKDGRTLLEAFKRRRDLLATIDVEINEILKKTTRASSPPPRTPEPRRPPLDESPQAEVPATPPQPVAETERGITPLERIFGALVGGVIGTIIVAPVMSTLASDSVLGLLPGAGGAIAGAISGTRGRVIITALACGIIGCLVVFVVEIKNPHAFVNGVIFGSPVGAILGAIAGALLRGRKRPVA